MWERIQAALANDVDVEHRMINSTIVCTSVCGRHSKNGRIRPSGAVAEASDARFTSLWMG